MIHSFPRPTLRHTRFKTPVARSDPSSHAGHSGYSADLPNENAVERLLQAQATHYVDLLVPGHQITAQVFPCRELSIILAVGTRAEQFVRGVGWVKSCRNPLCRAPQLSNLHKQTIMNKWIFCAFSMKFSIFYESGKPTRVRPQAVNLC